jgi:integrase
MNDKRRRRQAWEGTVEKFIRKVVVRGRSVYRVQMGGMGRGNRRSRICERLEEALQIKSEWIAGGVPIVRDADPAAAPPAIVEDGLRHYVNALKKAGKDWYRVQQLVPMLAREMPELLAKPIDLVSLDDFTTFRILREQPRLKRNGEMMPIRPNTIRRDMGILRAMVKKAQPGFEVPDETFPAAENDRVRFLSPDEEIQTEVTLEVDEHPTLMRLGRLMMLNITRQHDWRLLRRERVHLVERRIEFPASKGAVRDLTNLSDESVALLKSQLASHTSPWVFVNQGTGRPYSRVHVNRVLRRAIRASGRTDFTPHDLKHHVASSFTAQGATDRELQAAGGWKTTGMLRKYAHVRSQRLRELNQRVSGSVRESPSIPRT